jgi:hypothetical protein
LNELCILGKILQFAEDSVANFAFRVALSSIIKLRYINIVLDGNYFDPFIHG